MWNILRDFQLGRTHGAEHEDRAMVLILGSILEDGLQRAIETHFWCIPREERSAPFSADDDAPLSGFAAKISFGYALGIFGKKSRQDLTSIKTVRNCFAHIATDLDFRSQEIVDACCNINFLDLMLWTDVSPEPRNAKEQFIAAVMHFYVYFAVQSRHPRPVRYADYDFPEWYS
jgi:hypothetical protein